MLDSYNVLRFFLIFLGLHLAIFRNIGTIPFLEKANIEFIWF